MKLFIVFSFLLALSLLTMAKTVSPKKSIMKQNLSSKIAVEVKVKEEKKVFETLIIQFLSFGHEHSSSGPDEAFSATTGVYSFKFQDGTHKSEEITIYTDSEGRSQTYNLWNLYEIKLIKTSNSQTIVSMEIVKLK
jgi:hypothetical protein